MGRNHALYVQDIPSIEGGGPALDSLDGRARELPKSIDACCLSFSPDGRFVIASVDPGEDCSLIEVTSGNVVASVRKAPGLKDDDICTYVGWTTDGRYAIATDPFPP